MGHTETSSQELASDIACVFFVNAEKRLRQYTAPSPPPSQSAIWVQAQFRVAREFFAIFSSEHTPRQFPVHFSSSTPRDSGPLPVGKKTLLSVGQPRCWFQCSFSVTQYCHRRASFQRLCTASAPGPARSPRLERFDELTDLADSFYNASFKRLTCQFH